MLKKQRKNIRLKNDFNNSPDKNDALYFALALKMNSAIWSDDKKMKEQNKVKVYSTSELMRINDSSSI